MIIGINGKIGSGKDTVGKIIQCLTQGINSEKQIVDYCNGVKITGFDWKIKKFAGKLKQIGSLLTGIPIEKFEDQDFKKTNLEKNWDVKSKYRDRRPPEPMTVREFLQKLGTEAMREGLHTNVWVNALFADYKIDYDSYAGEVVRDSYPNWIITDMRFPNEMEAVELREGITIRVNRNNGTRAIDVNPHPSETALDDAKFDYEIINDGTLQDLVENVREILTKENII
jgi:hypothetical protein